MTCRTILLHVPSSLHPAICGCTRTSHRSDQWHQGARLISFCYKSPLVSALFVARLKQVRSSLLASCEGASLTSIRLLQSRLVTWGWCALYLKASCLENLDADVRVALHAQAQLHLMRKLPLGILDFASADRYHVAGLVLVLVRQADDALVALREQASERASGGNMARVQGREGNTRSWIGGNVMTAPANRSCPVLFNRMSSRAFLFKTRLPHFQQNRSRESIRSELGGRLNHRGVKTDPQQTPAHRERVASAGANFILNHFL